METDSDVFYFDPTKSANWEIKNLTAKVTEVRMLYPDVFSSIWACVKIKYIFNWANIVWSIYRIPTIALKKIRSPLPTWKKKTIKLENEISGF